MRMPDEGKVIERAGKHLPAIRDSYKIIILYLVNKLSDIELMPIGHATNF